MKQEETLMEKVSPALYAASLAGVALGSYHGYKRNQSVPWAIAWGLLGGAFPLITLPVAYAQGFAKRITS